MTNTQDPTPDGAPDALSRRAFLKGAGGVAAAGSVLQDGAAPAAPAQDATTLAGTVEVTLNLNGADQRVEVEPRTTLARRLCVTDLEPAAHRCTKQVCDNGATAAPAR